MKKLGNTSILMMMLYALLFAGTTDIYAQSATKHIDSFEQEGQDIQLEETKPSFKTQSVKDVDLDKIKDRQIVIKVEKGSKADLSHYSIVRDQNSNETGHWVTVSIPDNQDYLQELKNIREMDQVELASPNEYFHTDFLPKDTYYKNGDQSYLKLIGMEQAWDVTRGDKGVKVAVIDTGVYAEHKDLQGRLTDGYDTLNKDHTPDDKDGHGTHVAGIIAANTNSFGITGTAPGVSVVPIKTGTGDILSSDAIIAGINYAITKKVDVINMSFGSFDSNSGIEGALWEAHKKGIVLVASSGNDESSKVAFPAAYPWVIAVGATDLRTNTTKKADFSNFGGFLDIMAPGVYLKSTSLTGGYDDKLNGTSFSAPVISGLAALLKTKHPDWQPEDIEFALENGAAAMGSQQFSVTTGFGEVNGNKALHSLLEGRKKDGSSFSITNTKLLTEPEYNKEGLDFPNDQDLYRMEITHTGTASVTIHSPAKYMDLVARLYQKKDGKLSRLMEEDEGMQGDSETLDFTISPGTYYIGITDYYENWSKQNYSIEVKKQLDQPVRINGSTRYETAVEISKKGWSKADTVVLATGDNFPDALSGSPLAYALHSPILLTKRSSLAKETEKELTRLGAKNVYILGGEGAVSDQVRKSLEAMDINVTRLAGTNRYETSAEIAKEMLKIKGETRFDKAIVSSGEKFPDALSSASYAARNGYPILLTKQNELPEVSREITEQTDHSLVVGGSGVVSEQIMDELPDPVRYAGTNRYATTVAFLDGLKQSSKSVYVATGEKFADALTGSVLAAKNGSPIVLVKEKVIPEEIQTYINEHHPAEFKILGGEGAVNQVVGADLLNEMKKQG